MHSIVASIPSLLLGLLVPSIVQGLLIIALGLRATSSNPFATHIGQRGATVYIYSAAQIFSDVCMIYKFKIYILLNFGIFAT